MNVVVEMIFGSHLYGTATENSDMDYKGVFLPSKRDLFLNRVSKSVNRNTKTDNNGKNTANDIDSEFYSLHYFIELACQGQTAAMEETCFG
jgi:predicted nucleotidyltransferase